MSSRRQFTLILLAAVAVLGACARQKAPQAAGPPVVPVSVTKAGREAVPFDLNVVGTVEASSIVQIKSQVAGELLRVHFNEGQNVSKGALLLEIDPQPYRDALRQAEANLGRDTTQAKNAEIDANRNAELEKA